MRCLPHQRKTSFLHFAFILNDNEVSALGSSNSIDETIPRDGRVALSAFIGKNQLPPAVVDGHRKRNAGASIRNLEQIIDGISIRRKHVGDGEFAVGGVTHQLIYAQSSRSNSLTSSIRNGYGVGF